MTDLTVKGQILSIYRGGNAANIFIVDQDNPKKIVYKAVLWNDEANIVLENLKKDDEITVSAKIYEMNSNQHGTYIDLRMCRVLEMAKLQRITVQSTVSKVVEGNPLPQKGE